MDINNTTSNVDWLESKLSTKHGLFSIGFLVAAIPLGFVVWFLFSQTGKRMETIGKKEEQIELLIEREARIKDECAETMQKWFGMFKELGAQFSGNVNSVRAIEIQTNATIQQQQSIIRKATSDEKN